jgi:hypothetical protein
MHNSISMIFLKRFAMVGFEPGSSVPEADAMCTVPRRQGEICEGSSPSESFQMKTT